MPRAPLACTAAFSALVVLAHGLVRAEELCDTMQFGNETQFALSRAVRRVEPGLFTLEISESHVCSDSEAVGLKVTACDFGQMPRVLLLDATHAVVVRAGAASPAHAAYIYVNVYCAADIDDAALESVDSPIEVKSFLGESLFQSPSLNTVHTQDSLPLLEVEPGGSTNEYLPPVKLESRIFSLDQSNGPSIPTSLSSRIKDLWKDHAAPSLGQFKSQSFPEGTSSRLQENEQSVLDKAKHQPSIFDSYSTLVNDFPNRAQNPTSSPPDMSSPLLAKCLIDLRPKQPPKLFANRSPAWKQRPTRRPSNPWLKLRSLLDGETRKSMSLSRNRVLNRFSDYNDPWTPYEDDPLSLHWTDESTDSNPWDTESDSQSLFTSSLPWRNDDPYPSVRHERQSPSSIKHDSKKQSRYVPPKHEEDPALLLQRKKDHPWSQRPQLPKLLLLLQDQDHLAPIQRKCLSAHSVEDTYPWWSNGPNKEIGDEGIPWQPDYPADYTADDGDAWAYLQGYHTDDRNYSPHLAAAETEQAKAPVPHTTCTPFLAPLATAPVHALKHYPAGHKPRPLDQYLYYSPTPLTERPLLMSTVHNSLSWIKSSNAVPFKSPMKLKQPRSKKLLKTKDHHYPSNNYYPSKSFISTETHLPSEPNLLSESQPPEPYHPSEPNYSAEFHLPSEPHYSLDPHFPTETHYPSELHDSLESHLSSEPHYPSEPYYPSEPHYPLDPHIPSETHYPLEFYDPLDSHYPSEPHFPLDTHFPSETHYPSELHNPLEPHYPSESHYPSEPHYPLDSQFLSETHYPSELHNPLEPHYPSESHYPSEPHYPLDSQFPSETHYPSELHNPLEPHYPSESHYPSEPHYPLDSQFPSETHYPSELHNPLEPHYPSESHYPSEPHYPLDSQFPSETHYPSELHNPLEPHYPSEPHYPLDTHFPSESHYPSELYDPLEPHNPSESHHPSDPHIPSEPHFPLEPHIPSEPHFPSEHHYPPHHPSKPLYPSKPHQPSKPHYPSKPHNPSERDHSSSPWKFLTKLLFSHPIFRDSTQVIRIR